jgi:uncharacterized protein (TIGR00255 family)
MIRSMTGFGRATGETAGFSVSAEVRSVNGRFFKASWRLPEKLSPHEARLETVVREHVARGSVSIALRVSTAAELKAGPALNADRLKAYWHALDAARRELGTTDPISLAEIARLPGVLEEPTEEGSDDSELLAAAEKTLRDALAAFTRTREEEGAALAKDLITRCARLAEFNTTAQDRSPAVIDEYRTKLRERMAKLLEGSNVSLRDEDLAREVAHFADRCDISEENQRLSHHCATMASLLASSGSPAASWAKPAKSPTADKAAPEVGKRLDFIAQEMLREANTLGSKANDAQLADLVIRMKAEIEKIKEQVQNVE